MSQEKPLVVMSDYDFEDRSLELIWKPILAAGGEYKEYHCTNKMELLQVCGEASVLINEYLKPIDVEVMDAMPGCKAIVRTGIGVDTIDIQAASKRGIMVVNIPAYCLDEVSDHTLSLALALIRRLRQYDESIRHGAWDFKVGIPIERIRGQILGVIGYGKVSRRLRPKAEALGLRFVANDPYIDPYIAKADGVELLSLEQLLAIADLVSVHCPLNEETLGLLGENEFKKMKPNAVLLNTARGPIVQHDALVHALFEGWIAGAGLDVQESEPLSLNSPLNMMNNVILTPHVAWYSEGSQTELLSSVGEEAARIIKGERPLSVVNINILQERVIAMAGPSSQKQEELK
jgi:D-3-phosphoglycerate dehydrogenase